MLGNFFKESFMEKVNLLTPKIKRFLMENFKIIFFKGGEKLFSKMETNMLENFSITCTMGKELFILKTCRLNFKPDFLKEKYNSKRLLSNMIMVMFLVDLSMICTDHTEKEYFHLHKIK